MAWAAGKKNQNSGQKLHDRALLQTGGPGVSNRCYNGYVITNLKRKIEERYQIQVHVCCSSCWCEFHIPDFSGFRILVTCKRRGVWNQQIIARLQFLLQKK